MLDAALKNWLLTQSKVEILLVFMGKTQLGNASDALRAPLISTVIWF